MPTASAMLAHQQPRYRTPEELIRAYEQYRQDIEPLMAMMVRIRAMAMPHIHLRERADGSWEVISDPDEGLPPELREALAMLQRAVREEAIARGLAIDGGVVGDEAA